MKKYILKKFNEASVYKQPEMSWEKYVLFSTFSESVHVYHKSDSEERQKPPRLTSLFFQ